jgi:hypothetical protein
MDPMLIQSGNLCPRNLILKIQSRLNISGISLGSRYVSFIKSLPELMVSESREVDLIVWKSLDCFLTYL